MLPPSRLLFLLAAVVELTLLTSSRGAPPPVIDPPLPPPASSSWPQRDLDRFVLHNLQSAGLHPSPQTEPGTLLRRVCLDLTGLPPSREQVLAFRSGPSSSHYEAVVDRLLSSPQFGERWASVWLDAARYADTQGYEK